VMLAAEPRPWWPPGRGAAKSPETPLVTTVGERGIFAVVTYDRTVG
jgi:hypothetical protein